MNSFICYNSFKLGPECCVVQVGSCGRQNSCYHHWRPPVTTAPPHITELTFSNLLRVSLMFSLPRDAFASEALIYFSSEVNSLCLYCLFLYFSNLGKKKMLFWWREKFQMSWRKYTSFRLRTAFGNPNISPKYRSEVEVDMKWFTVWASKRDGKGWTVTSSID